MKLSSIFLSCVALLCFSNCASADNKKMQVVAPSNPNLVYEGRVEIDKSAAHFFYPGTSVRMSFSGQSLAAHLKCNSAYYMVTIDSMAPFKLSTFVADSLQKDSVFTIAENLKAGYHTVELALVTEGYFGHPEFYGFRVDEDALLGLVRRKSLRFEFVGNSITCAYGVEAASQKEHFTLETENFYHSYADILCRRFDAEPMVVARSGIGVYRNYGGPTEGNPDNLPSFYDHVSMINQKEWNFCKFTPDILFINLGTNDLSTGQYNLEKMTAAYIAFVDHIREVYPKTKIVLLEGCLLKNKRLEDYDKVHAAVYKHRKQQGDEFIYRFSFTPQTGKLGFGADFHPSMKQQRLMADEITPFIETTFSIKAK